MTVANKKKMTNKTCHKAVLTKPHGVGPGSDQQHFEGSHGDKTVSVLSLLELQGLVGSR